MKSLVVFVAVLLSAGSAFATSGMAKKIVFTKNALGDQFVMDLDELPIDGTVPVGPCNHGSGWARVKFPISVSIDGRPIYDSEMEVQAWHDDQTECHLLRNLTSLMIPLRNKNDPRLTAQLTISYYYRMTATLKTSEGEYYRGDVTESY